ncbi:unnamed protein product [Amoebophrya sp. A120]|nr:unnamed protein product [Amoebophrya sp. A120]|eukprot:GSA120T00025951001.1
MIMKIAIFLLHLQITYTCCQLDRFLCGDNQVFFSRIEEPKKFFLALGLTKQLVVHMERLRGHVRSKNAKTWAPVRWKTVCYTLETLSEVTKKIKTLSERKDKNTN